MIVTEEPFWAEVYIHLPYGLHLKNDIQHDIMWFDMPAYAES